MNKLTVLMTVYNGEAYLREAMESILGQTYGDFKFLVIDNASTDRGREIIESYNDERIEMVGLKENIGQIPALNKGLSMIKTPYIARMDADDIALPRRLARQVEFMDSHPQVAVCGTFAEAFNHGTGAKTKWEHPELHQDIVVRLLFECCLVHPSVMMRKDFLNGYGLKYNEEIGHSEDWLLWHQVSRHGELYNIPEVLLRYRVHGKSESRRILDRQLKAAERLDRETLGLLKLEDHGLKKIHRDVAFETLNIQNREAGFLDQVVEWFNLLRQANQAYRVYDERALDSFLRRRLFVVLTNNTQQGRLAWQYFFQYRLYRDIKVTWTIKFLLKWVAAFIKGGKQERGVA